MDQKVRLSYWAEHPRHANWQQLCVCCAMPKFGQGFCYLQSIGDSINVTMGAASGPATMPALLGVKVGCQFVVCWASCCKQHPPSNEELLHCSTLVLGHQQHSSIQLLRTAAQQLANGVTVNTAAGNLHLVWDLPTQQCSTVAKNSHVINSLRSSSWPQPLSHHSHCELIGTAGFCAAGRPGGRYAFCFIAGTCCCSMQSSHSGCGCESAS